MSDAARYLRQVLLPEIGQAGQARIQAARARVGVGGGGSGGELSHEVAELYARAAGFGAIGPGAIDVGELAPLAEVRSPAAREVLAGARAALAAVREAALAGGGYSCKNALDEGDGSS